MDIFHNILLLTCPHIEPNTCFAKRHFLSSFGPKDVFYQSAFLVHVSTQRNIPPMTLLPFQREASSTSCPTSLVLPLSLLPLKCEVNSTAILARGELYQSSCPTSLVLEDEVASGQRCGPLSVQVSSRTARPHLVARAVHRHVLRAAPEGVVRVTVTDLHATRHTELRARLSGLGLSGCRASLWKHGCSSSL